MGKKRVKQSDLSKKEKKKILLSLEENKITYGYVSSGHVNADVVCAMISGFLDAVECISMKNKELEKEWASQCMNDKR